MVAQQLREDLEKWGSFPGTKAKLRKLDPSRPSPSSLSARASLRKAPVRIAGPVCFETCSSGGILSGEDYKCQPFHRTSMSVQLLSRIDFGIRLCNHAIGGLRG